MQIPQRLKEYFFVLISLMSGFYSYGVGIDTTFRSRFTYGLADLGTGQQSLDFTNLKIGSVLTLQFDYQMASDAVTNTFSNGYLIKTHFDEALKQKVIDRLKENNTYLLDFNGAAYYQKRVYESGALGEYSWGIGLFHRNLTAIYFPRDLMRLIFEGNGPFEDDTAYFDNLAASRFIYTGLNYTLIKTIRKYRRLYEVGGGIGFLQGQGYWHAESARGNLYTAPDGEFLTMDYDITLQQGYRDGLNPFEFNGIGMTSSAFFSFQYKEKTALRLSVENIGFITWFRETATYHKDSLATYNGIEVKDILNVDEKSFTQDYVDTLTRRFIPQASEEGFTSVLPVVVNLSFAKIFNYKWTLNAGIKYMALPGYLPFIYVKPNRFFRHSTAVSLIAGYGGYGTYRLGVELDHSFEKFNITIGSNALQGFIIPYRSTDASLYIRLMYLFRKDIS